MKKLGINKESFSARLFFVLALSVFTLEQISNYHFDHCEVIELSDSEEGEEEIEKEEREKKECVSHQTNFHAEKSQGILHDFMNVLGVLCLLPSEVTTPPPKV